MGIEAKILITGGAGFVGSQLGYQLSRLGHEVILLDNMSFGNIDNLFIDGKTFGQFIVADIRDRNIAHHFKNVDTVFHFAGIAALPVCQSDPLLAYEVNAAGVGNVLEFSRMAGVRRVIFSSTSAVYENSKSKLQKEDEIVEPNLIYSMTKLAAEKICEAYSKNYQMDIVISRFFNVYGPHQDIKRKSPPFTSYVAKELSQGRSPKLYNNSDSERDYIYVDDVIALLVKMMKSEKKFRSDIFNIGSGVSYSVPNLFERMRSFAKKSIEPTYCDPMGFWDNYSDLFASKNPMSRERVVKEVYKNSCGDISKSKKEFDWVPKVSIDAGLKNVYEYALKAL